MFLFLKLGFYLFFYRPFSTTTTTTTDSTVVGIKKVETSSLDSRPNSDAASESKGDGDLDDVSDESKSLVKDTETESTQSKG